MKWTPWVNKDFILLYKTAKNALNIEQKTYTQKGVWYPSPSDFLSSFSYCCEKVIALVEASSDLIEK